MKWPSLPGPVKQGDAAPKLQAHAYRGPVAASLQKQHLLYFWATWCGPCKAAVPELVAYEQQTGVPVIAVTDEDKKTLDAFVRNFPIPFPQAIATDELRQAFVAYGVSGTPTFVLVDDQGKVLWSQIGYRPGQGLTIPGWTWNKSGATSP
jgi:thiol-disulfide isomerase/thioredoxin